MIMPDNVLSLLELTGEIKDIITANTAKNYWVKGEISELKENIRGHCYLELIQKDEGSEQILARSRAIIWAQNFRLIKPYFETTTGQKLTEGIGIMVQVSVEFHEIYGLSLNIRDIEPSYTVGEMALRKQKVIDRLTQEGVIDMNREMELNVPCRKIAIISSPTAAGYEDFREQLDNNSYEYKFYLKLFPAIMQGKEAEQSMIAALDKIYQYDTFFDAVVIIRGGGSQTDLNCFDSYWLAYHITQFPLPVLTGIGHEQDDSVVDLVAHTRLKTPTAVAAYLIELMSCQDSELEELSLQIFEVVRSCILIETNALSQIVGRIQFGVKEKVNRHDIRLREFTMELHRNSMSKTSLLQRNLDKKSSRLLMNASSVPSAHFKTLESTSKLLRQAIERKKQKIRQKFDLAEEKLHAYDPERVLERGYSITLKEGELIKDSSQLKEDDSIITILKKGKVESIIKKSRK